MLGTQHRRIKINKGGNFIISGWHGRHLHSFHFIVKRNIGVDAVPCFGSILLQHSGFFNDFYKWFAAAIYDGYFRTIDFYQAVINAHAYQRCQYMFYRTHFYFALF